MSGFKSDDSAALITFLVVNGIAILGAGLLSPLWFKMGLVIVPGLGINFRALFLTGFVAALIYNVPFTLLPSLS